MIVTFSRDRSYPQFTLGALLINRSASELIFKPTRNLLRICEVRSRIESNWETYSKIIKNSSDLDHLKMSWNKAGQDIDLDSLEPMKYPKEYSKAIRYIHENNLNRIDAVIKLCESVGIDLEYVNLEKDKYKITHSENTMLCTKKMLYKFPKLLKKIDRLEYINIINKFGKGSAIRTSTNKYYTRNETSIHNSVPSV